LSINIALEAIQLLAPVYLKKSVADWSNSLKKIQELVSKINFYNWHCFTGMVPLGLAIFNAIEAEDFKETALAKQLDMSLEDINKSIKILKGMHIHDSMRRIFKGLKLWAKGKKKAAMKAWKKGIDDQAEDIYTQAFLHSAIAATGEDNDGSDEKAEEYIRDLKCKQRFGMIFPLS
jgi:predicted Zn-dependent protease